MTFVGIINAAGQFIPPVFIIPRKRWNDAFMRETMHGSLGILHQNGWMNGECFVKTLQHVHEKTYSSVENKILLIIDNAEVHMNIQAVEYAIQKGIVIVTLPPHTTDKLQPLDVSVYGPFKSHMRALQNDYALMHPNKDITVHMLPQFACKAWIKGCTPSNVLSGFASTGIWPINSGIFPEDAFIGAQVTEQPPPENLTEEVSPASSVVAEDLQTFGHDLLVTPTESPRHDDDFELQPDYEYPISPVQPLLLDNPEITLHSSPSPSTSTANLQQPPPPSTSTADLLQPPPPSTPTAPTPSQIMSCISTKSVISPENVRPFPKADPRPRAKGRKRIRACILTEDEDAIAALRAKDDKKRKLVEKKRNAEERKRNAEEEKKRKAEEKKEERAAKKKEQEKGKGKHKGKAKKQQEVVLDLEAQELESEEEDEAIVELNDSSEYSDEGQEEDSLPQQDTYPFAQKEPEVRDFIG